MSVWGAVVVAAVVVAGWQGVLLLAGAVQAFGQGVPFAEGHRIASLQPLNLALAQGAASLAAGWIGLALFRTDEGEPAAVAMRLQPVGLGVLALSVVAGLSVHFPLTELENLLRELHPLPVAQQLRIRQMLTPDGPWDALAIILAIVVVAPVSEEAVFRGVILPGVERRHGAAVALATSSLLFGAAHLEPVAIVYAAVGGLLLGAVAIRTRSTWPAIAMHAGINAVPILLPARLVRIAGVNTISEQVDHVPGPLLLLTTAIAVAALLGLRWLADREAP